MQAPGGHGSRLSGSEHTEIPHPSKLALRVLVDDKLAVKALFTLNKCLFNSEGQKLVRKQIL